MNPALKSMLLCSCFFVSSVLASAQGTTCAADSENAQGSAIGCVTGEGVVVQAGADAASQGSEALPLTPEQRPAAAPVVIFRDGKLAITAKNSDLGEILRQVGEKTGATIDVPEGANERVVSQLGPGTPRDVIAALLNGSHYNYVVLGNETDANAVARVVLTAKSDGKTPSGSAPVDAVVASDRSRPVIQPRTALQQAVMQPYQEMLQQQQAQQLVVPDFQQQAQATPASDGSAPAPQATATGEAVTQPTGAETASVEPAPASDGAQRSNAERTPQQMLQDLYETRRQMIQQQNQQRVAQQQPPQQP